MIIDTGVMNTEPQEDPYENIYNSTDYSETYRETYPLTSWLLVIGVLGIFLLHVGTRCRRVFCEQNESEPLIRYLRQDALIPHIIHVSGPSETENMGVCPICLEQLLDDGETSQKSVKIACGHVFHTPCISEWFRKNMSCPICREEV